MINYTRSYRLYFFIITAVFFCFTTLLSQNGIMVIFKDSRGSMRFGTRDGLNINDNITTQKIIKLKPYWKITWSYILSITTLIIIFFIIRRYHLAKLNLKNNLKLERLEKKQIEDLTKIKLIFFTNIFHEFKTPLTLIHGPLQYLLKKINNIESRNHLLLIEKNVSLMLKLTNQLMDFQKLQAGSISLNLVHEPLLPFIKEIMFSFQEMAKIHRIKYLFTSKISNKKAYFDKSKIEKILYNLLSNAFKHTPDNGKITLEVYIKHGESKEDLDYLEISIKNTRYGIEKKNLGNIFDRFFKTEGHVGHTQAGSEIGLSIVKKLIKLHKGYVKVYSKFKKYTEFIVGIPLEGAYTEKEKLTSKYAPEFKSEKNNKPAVLKLPSKNSNAIKTYSVLIVEDNSDLRNFLAKMLSNKYSILTAENGKVGLFLAQKHKPDIIISDIMIPKINGIKLCKILKENSKTSHIPIILLTAKTTASTEINGYKCGANDFISKPFNIEVLKYKIYNLTNSMDRIKKYSIKKILLEDKEINSNTADDIFLENLSKHIRNNIANPSLSVSSTSKELGISRVHLFRKVKSLTSKTPVEFIRNFRLSSAAELLEQEKYNINEISYKAGFQDINYFRKCFKKKYGISPKQYAKKQKEILLKHN